MLGGMRLSLPTGCEARAGWVDSGNQHERQCHRSLRDREVAHLNVRSIRRRTDGTKTLESLNIGRGAGHAPLQNTCPPI